MASPDGSYAAFYAPSEFVALIREEIPFKEALEMINERIEESVVQEILREERYSLPNLTNPKRFYFIEVYF